MFSEFNLFGYETGTFPVCVGIGLASGVFVIFLHLKKIAASIAHENAVMLAIPLTFIAGTIGAHITDILLRGGLLALLKTPFAYGLTFYGWLLSASLFLAIYSKKSGISLTYLFDLFFPTFAIGQAFGRIGCFLGGCCYGSPATMTWGVSYPPDTLPYKQYGAIPLIPVQLYESAYLFLIFIVLVTLIRFKHRGALYLIMLALGRFILEFFRADDRGRLFCDTFSPSQWISAVIFTIGILWLISINKKDKNYVSRKQ